MTSCKSGLKMKAAAVRKVECNFYPTTTTRITSSLGFEKFLVMMLWVGF